MNENEFNNGPDDEAKAAELGAKPNKTEPSGSKEPNVLADLMREIDSLLESDQDKPRLRQLLVELDAEQLRRIDKNLADLNNHGLARLVELNLRCNVFIESVKGQMKRIDLTFTEIIFLNKIIAEIVHQERKDLLHEKKRIEQKCRPRHGPSA